MTNASPQVPAALRGEGPSSSRWWPWGLLIAFGRAFAALYVEILWQTGSGYGSIFWTRVLWEGGVRLLAGLPRWPA